MLAPLRNILLFFIFLYLTRATLAPCRISANTARSRSSIRRTSQRQASSISWQEATNYSSNVDNKKAGRSRMMNNEQDNKM
jgi:hypothetical protein